MYKIGFSKDIHRLVEGRKLIISGVTIDFTKGEEAHSDGDVFYHAVAEAILGALALGDLGTHFPSNHETYKNMSSDKIVSYVYDLMSKEGYEINNIDTQIILEKPKLSPYISQMRNNLADLLHTAASNISIKAGTNEGIDATGKNEAIEVFAIVLLKKRIVKEGKEDN